MYYPRAIEKQVLKSIKRFPITIILGPSKSGKTTLAKHILALKKKNSLYLNQKRLNDLKVLDDPEQFLSQHNGKLICIDDIQDMPELFSFINNYSERAEGNGHFLILGSLSEDLIKQNAESFKKRASYHYLGPFTWPEVSSYHTFNDYLIRGGFPGSLLARSIDESLKWRINYISAVVNTDLRNLMRFKIVSMNRLWQLLAKYNGQPLNRLLLSKIIGFSPTSVVNYIELLRLTFMVNLVEPFPTDNKRKRIIQSPKLYLNDHGLAHAFIGILSFNLQSGHILLDVIWESIVLHNLKTHLPGLNIYFYRVFHGPDVNFVVEYGQRLIAVECKTSPFSIITSSNLNAIHDVGAEKLIVITPAELSLAENSDAAVTNIPGAIALIKQWSGLK